MLVAKHSVLDCVEQGSVQLGDCLADDDGGEQLLGCQDADTELGGDDFLACAEPVVVQIVTAVIAVDVVQFGCDYALDGVE